MVYSRFDNLDGERQERLIRVAAEEFAGRGYEGASVNRIAEGAGMSKGSLYYYFEDKADLYATVVERATARMIELAGGFSLDRLTPSNFWPTIEALTAESGRYLEENPWYMRLLRSFYRLRGGPADRGGTERVFDVVREWIGRILARGQELGVVRTDLPLEFQVEICMGMGEAGDRWIAEHWEAIEPGRREAVMGGYMTLFRRLLEPERRP
ncbi:MAG: TetR/AcrR family transcriptional regulator [Candidatus Palauibacterales bacterium]|nr:TetR/AcrR family transcriptional regulator [Candidatus Palauibacterales bacterium]MDP2530858.1 TetR/AcrR family transcriptional regulator [Candidatus Palauibacterales bacterium]MDP2584524.1 TetR/AcrR family transcriptional regulator [Candidatus Palauibacterales bacterium]